MGDLKELSDACYIAYTAYIDADVARDEAKEDWKDALASYKAEVDKTQNNNKDTQQ